MQTFHAQNWKPSLRRDRSETHKETKPWHSLHKARIFPFSDKLNTGHVSCLLLMLLINSRWPPLNKYLNGTTSVMKKNRRRAGICKNCSVKISNWTCYCTIFFKSLHLDKSQMFSKRSTFQIPEVFQMYSSFLPHSLSSHCFCLVQFCTLCGNGREQQLVLIIVTTVWL